MHTYFLVKIEICSTLHESGLSNNPDRFHSVSVSILPLLGNVFIGMWLALLVFASNQSLFQLHSERECS